MEIHLDLRGRLQEKAEKIKVSGTRKGESVKMRKGQSGALPRVMDRAVFARLSGNPAGENIRTLAADHMGQSGALPRVIDNAFFARLAVNPAKKKTDKVRNQKREKCRKRKGQSGSLPCVIDTAFFARFSGNPS